MTEQQGSKWSGWGRAVGVHLGIVGLSFILSILLLPQIIPFDPEGAGAVAAVFGVLLGHGVAAVVGLLFPKTSIISCGVVFCIAFFFTACFLVDAIKDWRYLHYQAAHDRFRDHVSSPIPKSVSNLRFVGLEDGISTDLMFRFDIAPEDLDAILTNLRMTRVDPKALPNPMDFFQYPYYLPIDDDDFELYQGKDRYEEELTLKTNKSHTHAIFRQESSRVYRERRWENQPEIQIKMDNEALARMKRRRDAGKPRD